MKLLFETECKLNKKIRISIEHWEHIKTIKHPEVEGLEENIKQTLINPLEIKRSSSDKDIYLYYSNYKIYFLCVVVKHSNGNGFIITSYITSKIKKGDIVWKP
jgi:hypothetical protein